MATETINWFEPDPRCGAVYGGPMWARLRTASPDDLLHHLSSPMDAWIDATGTTVMVDGYDESDPLVQTIRREAAGR